MRIILDTNVFVSGVFFTGPPYEILKGWRDGKWQLVISGKETEITAQEKLTGNSQRRTLGSS